MVRRIEACWRVRWHLLVEGQCFITPLNCCLPPAVDHVFGESAESWKKRLRRCFPYVEGWQVIEFKLDWDIILHFIYQENCSAKSTNDTKVLILLNYSFDFGHEFLCFYDQIINIQSSLFHVYSNIHFCMKYAQAKMSDMSV